MSGAGRSPASTTPRFVSGLMFPEGAIPMPPMSSAVRSDRMSPNRLPVTMTSNWVGSFTSCIAAASTKRCRVLTFGCLPALLPERAGVGHCVGLVDHHHLFVRSPECVLNDPGHARVGVDVFLDRELMLGPLLETAAHADIEALGVLADHQQVHRAAVFPAQR